VSRPLRIAVSGAGFWTRFQLAAWRELDGVEIVAISNRMRERAERLAEEFRIPLVAETVEEMLIETRPDALDIVTAVEMHRPNVELAIAHGVPAICQKPLASNLEDARAMVMSARDAGVPLAVHENFRWQTTMRALKAELESGAIGTPFRARISFCSAFPVFENQPFLRELEQFILTDVGSHILDLARFLFGEATSIFCRTAQVNDGIAGEDVATAVLHQGPTTTICEMSFASHLERQPFPQTLALVEGSRGSIEVAEDYWIRTTVDGSTSARRVPPPLYPWADPAYAVVHASIVPCNAHLLSALRDGAPAETSGEDNLRTLELVFAAYESAAGEAVIATDPQPVP
jgi:predicted dehydrogenase